MISLSKCPRVEKPPEKTAVVLKKIQERTYNLIIEMWRFSHIRQEKSSYDNFLVFFSIKFSCGYNWGIIHCKISEIPFQRVSMAWEYPSQKRFSNNLGCWLIYSLSYFVSMVLSQENVPQTPSSLKMVLKYEITWEIILFRNNLLSIS